MVTTANLQAVCACLSACQGEGNRALAGSIQVGSRVCIECWPHESMEIVERVLGASIMVLEDGELRSGLVTGLRVAGSWQRQRSITVTCMARVLKSKTRY